LRKIDECSEDLQGKPASVVIPLLGTGAGGGKVEDVARDLFDAALDYLEGTPDTVVETVWFLAYFGQHWDACVKAFNGLKSRLQPEGRNPPRAPGGKPAKTRMPKRALRAP
jgi:hypothetical protein